MSILRSGISARRWGLALSMTTVVGCATPELPPAVFAGSMVDALGGSASPPIEAPTPLADPFRLDDAARAWLDARVLDAATPAERLDRLVQLFRPGGSVALRYELTRSTDALQTLAAGEGNCLSFTVLFVALARELGLEARVQEISIPESWSRMDDVAVANRHVVAWGRLDGRVWEVDFGRFARPAGTPQRLLDDREVAAALASNRGATLLAFGGDGTSELRSAVDSAPELAQGWTNLGVALARTGESAGAEYAFRRALEHEPGDGTALSGLLRLYQELAPEAASDLEARMPQLLARNPYFLYYEGLELQHGGELGAAEEHFRRALRIQSDEPWFHLALVRNRLAAGDVADAGRVLRRARRDMADEAQYALLINELLRGTDDSMTGGIPGGQKSSGVLSKAPATP